MKWLILLLLLVGCGMNDSRMAIVEPLNINKLDTTVTDGTYDIKVYSGLERGKKIVEYPDGGIQEHYIQTDMYATTPGFFEQEVKVGDYIYAKDGDDDAKYIATLGATRDSTWIIYIKPVGADPLDDDTLRTVDVTNLSLIGREKLQIDGVIKKAIVPLIPFGFESTYSVGEYVFSYFTSTGKIHKIYLKIKDGGDDLELGNSEYWKQVDVADVFKEVSKLNQDRCLDEALDTRTYMPMGGEYILQGKDAKCPYNFVALSNCKTTGDFSIKFFNQDDTPYLYNGESIDIGEAKMKSILNCCENEAEVCLSPVYKEYPFMLPIKSITSDTKVKVTFDSETWLGNIFFGTRVELPCVSSNFSQTPNRAGKLLENEVSGMIKETSPERLVLNRSDISITMKNQKEVGFYYDRLKAYLGRIIYFDPTFTENGERKEMFRYLAHSGAISGVTISNPKDMQIKFSIYQYNNSGAV